MCRLRLLSGSLTRHPTRCPARGVEAVSLSQATEFGAVYTPDQLYDISETARRLGLTVHMDGKRFANAVVATGFSSRNDLVCGR